MLALARGGFQVEEMVLLHYPNGVFIDTEAYFMMADKSKNATIDVLNQMFRGSEYELLRFLFLERGF